MYFQLNVKLSSSLEVTCVFYLILMCHRIIQFYIISFSLLYEHLGWRGDFGHTSLHHCARVSNAEVVGGWSSTSQTSRELQLLLDQRLYCAVPPLGHQDIGALLSCQRLVLLIVKIDISNSCNSVYP